MIRSFRDDMTRAVWERKIVRKFDAQLQHIALRKLTMLNAAANVADLRIPPANHLEKLKGDRAGQYSIRINQRWRICFRWTPAGPTDVEIVDYH